MTPESSRELADLRRRAYGPDADILGDPDAVRRLRELESQDRPDEPVVPAQGTVASAEAPDAPSATAALPPRSAAETPSAAAGRPHRRVPVWATITAVGIVGLIVGMAISASIAPRADATLKPLDHMQVDLEDDWLLSISQWMTADAKPTQHEPFHKLQVLSATSKEGTSCLVVTWSRPLVGLQLRTERNRAGRRLRGVPRRPAAAGAQTATRKRHPVRAEG